MNKNTGITLAILINSLLLSGCQTNPPGKVSGKQIDKIAHDRTVESLQFGNGINFTDLTEVSPGSAVEDQNMDIKAPKRADNGNTIPVTATYNAKVRSFTIKSNRHHSPIATFDFEQGALPYVSTRIRMGADGKIYIFAETDNRKFYKSMPIKVIRSGQSNLTPCTVDKLLIAPVPKGGNTLVKLMFKHCMNSDNYIKDFKVIRDGRLEVTANLSAGVSRNPFFSFLLDGYTPFQQIKVISRNNKNHTWVATN